MGESVEVGESVGRVETQVVRIELPPEGFLLQNGAVLPELEIAYEAYGTLTPARDNVIFICHALSGDAHVAGYHTAPTVDRGWWDAMVGPGKGIDTRYYYVICANVLGGCKGTTGPQSINPETGEPYGAAFPMISVADIVDAHCLLLKQLGIARLAVTVGGSFGGMQVLEWAIRRPGMMERCICIASAPSLSAQALAFDMVARGVITADPEWRDGNYYADGPGPVNGLAAARKIGHITYLSEGIMAKKFGRERKSGTDSDAEARASEHLSDFQIASYLDYQGDKFTRRFDANSYLRIMHAMDEFDLADRTRTLEGAFADVDSKMLVLALSSDWLFPPEQSKQIANALLRAGKQVSYCMLEAPHGHDAFLVEIGRLTAVMKAFLPWVPQRGADGAERQRSTAPERIFARTKRERDQLLAMIRPGARILDIGCGSGELLALLDSRCQTAGVGVDYDLEQVIQVMDRGYDIFQEDVDGGLAMIPDDAYDYAILSETLQVVRHPRTVLREMLRVAREGIVSFPNFGNIAHILHLWLAGRMPVGGALPFEWYETPNIHLFTLRDFMALCQIENIDVLDVECVPRGAWSRLLVAMGLCNLGADRVLVRVARGKW